MSDDDFWCKLDQLVAACQLKIDRPKGSTHPRYPAFIYPLDYGYLAGTRSGDGDGIDVWLGSLPERTVTGVICSVEVEQRDAEVKILLGCTPQEAREILKTHNVGAQAAILVERASASYEPPNFPLRISSSVGRPISCSS
jgi:inorganic pyrophosphatase